jgi:TadE-like protein
MRNSLRPSHRRRLRIRAQSIVEFALMLPVLLILLSGLFEFGFMFTTYLALLDAARNASRFASDSDFTTISSDPNCATTKDFFRQTACLALQELSLEQPTIELCSPGSAPREHCDGVTPSQFDDIIVSIYSVTKFGVPAASYPKIERFPNPGTPCGTLGWSYMVDELLGHPVPAAQCGPRSGIHISRFSNSDILSKLNMNAPNTAFIMVEINYHHWQILALPWFTQFIGDPITFRAYAVWPLTSAEPTSTT